MFECRIAMHEKGLVMNSIGLPAIVNLSDCEIFLVNGGAGSTPTCPSGYYVSSMTYDAGGNLMSYTCSPNQTTKAVEDSVSTANQVITFVKTAYGWVESFF